MNNRLIVAIALSLGACQQAAPPDSPPLAGARIGGPFTLVSEEGAATTERDFAGKHRLVYFGYTFCPDICPADLQKLMAGYRLLEKRSPETAAKLQPLMISIDPARDTPAVLKQYTAAFHPKLIGLTGSEAQVAAAAKRHAVAYSKAEGGGANDYLMGHTNLALLFGPAGEPLAPIPQDGTPEQIADALQRWIR